MIFMGKNKKPHLEVNRNKANIKGTYTLSYYKKMAYKPFLWLQNSDISYFLGILGFFQTLNVQYLNKRK